MRPGWCSTKSSTQQSWPCPPFPSRPALLQTSFSPGMPQGCTKAWSFTLSCHLYKLLGNFQQRMEQGQPWHVSCPGDSYGESRHNVPDPPLLPAHPWQKVWMEARRSVQPGGTFNARGGHQENESCLPWHWLLRTPGCIGKALESKIIKLGWVN